MASSGSMYIRLKRQKMTVFLHVDPTDTVAQVKSKLADVVQQPSDGQRIYKDSVVLEDGKSLAELKVENDDVLALTYKQPDGSWEEIDIESFDREKGTMSD